MDYCDNILNARKKRKKQKKKKQQIQTKYKNEKKRGM